MPPVTPQAADPAFRSLVAAVRSQVLPEADIVLMNPLHPDAARVRSFSFAECLHTPPMLARYSDESDAAL